MEDAIKVNVFENFAVDDVTIEDGVDGIMSYNFTESEKEDEPLVLKIALHHSDEEVTEHNMVYDVEHDMMVPLYNEAERITPYIQEGSQLDTLLAQR